MSNPASHLSEDFSNVRQQFGECRRWLIYCKLMLAADVESYVGKKRAKEWREKHGAERINEYFTSVQTALWNVFRKEFGLDDRFAQLASADKERALELFCISVATEAVRRLRSFEELGLVEPLKKGDEARALMALLKFSRFRKRPDTANLEKQLTDLARERNDSEFFVRLAKARGQPQIDFPDIPRDRIEQLLLACWDSPSSDTKGNYIPPLCQFTDDALASLIQLLFRQRNMRSDTIRKKWVRLGLLKMKKPLVVGLKSKSRLVKPNPRTID